MATSSIPARVEWPTVAIAAAIYGGWTALTYWHDAIPLPGIVVIGGWLIAWHGSLQHETIHGHPTGSRAVNTAIGAVPLALWLPYAIYRDSHVAHHRSPHITDPRFDPEARYVLAPHGLRHAAARIQATLIGRLAFGPIFAVAALLVREFARGRASPARVLRDWTWHAALVLPVVVWLEWTGFGMLRYVAIMVYPGVSLTLLRSFAEHRADLPGPNHAATVERAGVFALLYLNNHLHTAHHDAPQLAWYDLPAHQRAHRMRLTAQAGRVHRSYGEIMRRFAFKPHDALVHPSHDIAQ